MSDYKAQKILAGWFNGVAQPLPANIFVSISSTAWLSDGTSGTEPSGNGYVRQTVNTSTGFTTPTLVGGNWQVSNAADIVFPADITADWGSAAYVGTHDLVSAGNLLDFGAVGSASPVVVGDTLRILAGQLIIKLL